MIAFAADRKFRRLRRGLAPLELVLCLPILLFIMALMVNFATIASWKIRSQSVARHALWGSRQPRAGATNPRPQYWPLSADIQTAGAGNLPALDDPRVDLPVARGPLPYNTVVHEHLLDPTRGLQQGSAEIERDVPLLPTLGPYRLESEDFLLDDTWEHQRMGLAVWHNELRRIPVIYELARADAQYVDEYVEAVKNIIYASFRRDLWPLDRDAEFLAYSQRFGWGTGAPDFHPSLSGFCAVDHTLAQGRVDELVERVADVPRRMTEEFIDLYERVLDELEEDGSPAEIRQLQENISILQQFLARLEAGDS